MRSTCASVDLQALSANVAQLCEMARPARFCAVVKADGYGHGALAAARAALSGGADWLAVALVEEGVELRRAGLNCPILLLSEPRPSEMVEVAEHMLRPAVYSPVGLAAAAAAADARGLKLPVHLKIDTGMNRVGARPSDALRLAEAILSKEGLALEGVWTHCAVADRPEDSFTDTQLELFESLTAALAEVVPDGFLRHAANSALLLRCADTAWAGRFDLVRAGLTIYGLSPGAAQRRLVTERLRPVMGLSSEVSFVKRVGAGEGVSYGLSHRFESDTTVATVPIGYADGVRRDYGQAGGEVLIRGRRRRIVGVVTMDQLMVDCGFDSDVCVSDEVVLIGSQGEECIRAEEVADRLETIPYEVVCDIGKRVRREYR